MEGQLACYIISSLIEDYCDVALDPLEDLLDLHIGFFLLEKGVDGGGNGGERQGKGSLKGELSGNHVCVYAFNKAGRLLPALGRLREGGGQWHGGQTSQQCSAG